MTVRELIPTYKRSEYSPSVEFITNTVQAARYVRSIFPPDELEMRERFYAVYLTNRQEVLGYRLISVGGISSTVVDIRLVLQGALLTNATGILVAHNHPSGNLIPSEADEFITKKLSKAAAVMDYQLLDHIILVPDNDFYSFRDHGKL